MGSLPVSLSKHLYELKRPFAFQHYLENQGCALAMPAWPLVPNIGSWVHESSGLSSHESPVALW